MGFSYFNEHNYWSQITRDERTFCAELYFTIKGKEREFIAWLKRQPKIECLLEEDLNAEWEIGYEVCFYRDFICVIGDENKNKNIRNSVNQYPMKRTFDLCLFSEKKILIIEAKAQQGFHSKQNKEFDKDIEHLQTLLKNKVEVKLIALCSSTHLKNIELRSRDKKLPEVFSGSISWMQVNSFKSHPLFIRADECYNNNNIDGLIKSHIRSPK